MRNLERQSVVSWVTASQWVSGEGTIGSLVTYRSTFELGLQATWLAFNLNLIIREFSFQKSP